MPTTLTFPAPAKAKPASFSTAQELKALKKPAKNPTEHSDEQTPGLFVRITMNDVRTWIFRYTNPSGRKRGLTLGRFPDVGVADARELVRDHRGTLAKGEDPAEIKKKRITSLTFKEITQKWQQIHGRTLADEGAEVLRIVNADLSHWLPRKANEITKADAFEVIDAKRQAGHDVMGNAVYRTISRIYNFALERDWVDHNPVAQISKAKENPRQRVLTEDELRRIWIACETQSPHVEKWFKLRMAMGQRGNEIMRMRDQDINPHTHVWLIRDPKNGRDHPIFLTELAREVIAEIPRGLDPAWLFPCGARVKRNGEIEKGANESELNVMGDYKKTSRRLAQPHRANIVLATVSGRRKRGKRQVRYTAGFQGRDLRRTMTTMLASAGVPHDLLKKVLNHLTNESAAKDDVTMVYNQWAYPDEKKAIMELWGKQLRCILAGKPISEAGRFTMAPTLVDPRLSAIEAIMKMEGIDATKRMSLVATLMKAGAA